MGDFSDKYRKIRSHPSKAQGHLFFSFIGGDSVEAVVEFCFCTSSLCLHQVSAVSSFPFVVVLFFFPCWLAVFFNKAVMEASGPEDVLGRECCFTKAKQES